MPKPANAVAWRKALCFRQRARLDRPYLAPTRADAFLPCARDEPRERDRFIARFSERCHCLRGLEHHDQTSAVVKRTLCPFLGRQTAERNRQMRPVDAE
jgi:hypothetical protein